MTTIHTIYYQNYRFIFVFVLGKLQTLNGIQSIVAQCPALADLQRDLELMLPADCNANDTSTDQQSISTDSAINQSIDLSA